MERGDFKVQLGIALPLVASVYFEIKRSNILDVRASVFYSTLKAGIYFGYVRWLD